MANHLEDLPGETLSNILDYCEPFDPTIRQAVRKPVYDAKKRKFTTPTRISHPFYNLAATSKRLNAIVEEHSRFLLKSHAGITKKKTKTMTFRKAWLKYVDSTCKFCKKTTSRKCILDGRVACCHKCDRTQFPKLTMTEAQSRYHLTKLDIFTPNEFHPHFSPLSVGTYSCMGGTTTMVLTSDLERRAKDIWGPAAAPKDVQEAARRKSEHTRFMKKANLLLVNCKFVKTVRD